MSSYEVKKDMVMVKSVLGLFTFLHCAKQINMIKLFYPHTTASCWEADHKKTQMQVVYCALIG